MTDVSLGKAQDMISTLLNAPNLRYNSSNVYTMCNVGIGMSNVLYPLDVNGTIRATTIETNTLFVNGSELIGAGYVGTIDNTYKNDINNTSNMHMLQKDFGLRAAWGAGIHNVGGASGNDLCADHEGNTYVTGFINVSTSANSNNTIYNANGLISSNVTMSNNTTDYSYLIKYNSAGIAQWAAKVDSPQTDTGNGVCIDSNGNVYVCGSASSNAKFFHSTGQTFGAASAAGTHGYLTKYDSNGMVQWFAYAAASTTFRKVAIDDSRTAVYVCGDYTSASAQTIYNANNVSSGATLPATATSAAFVIAYSTSGQYRWRMRVDGTSGGGGRGVCVDRMGNVLFSGGYSSSNAIIYSSNNAVFAPAMRTANNVGAFVVKASPSGVALLHVLQDTNGNGGASDVALGVATDSSNNIIMTGQYGGGGSVGTFYTYPNTNSGSLPGVFGSAAYVAKWNSNGDVIQWMGRISSGASQTIAPFNVVTDASDNVYICGRHSLSNTTIWDATTSSGLAFPSGTSETAFLAKWSSGGVPQYGLALETSGTDQARGVSVDASGNVYMSGTYSGSNVNIYNQNSLNSLGAVSTVATLPGSSVVSTFIIKYAPNPLSYRLWSNLSSQYNGLIKTLLNESSDPVTVDVTSSNNNNVLYSIQIEASNATRYVWNNSKWFKLI
jgi:hypothetical protein